jgi:tetratricopeptide (TPR) repeat protein
MTFSVLEGIPHTESDRSYSYSALNTLIDQSIAQYEEIIHSYVRFHIVAWMILGIELIGILLFATFLTHYSLLAIFIALFFLSLFSYFILKIYYQSQKPERFLEFRDQYIESCKKLFKYKEGVPEYHTSLASACGKLASALQGRESTYYKSLPLLSFAKGWMEMFSAWWHWHDMHKIKELLLTQSIDEHIKLVRCVPTSLELHAALANAYVMLSGLYISAARTEIENRPYIPSVEFITLMQKKFRFAAQRAIEEFKILNEYAPNDPWVHAQLAYSYHDLQMPQEEIREYETIMQLRPQDHDTQYKLGVLYFEQGLNAKGLKVYEALKSVKYSKAEQLMSYYGIVKEMETEKLM